MVDKTPWGGAFWKGGVGYITKEMVGLEERGLVPTHWLISSLTGLTLAFRHVMPVSSKGDPALNG